MSMPVQTSNKPSWTQFIARKCKEQPFVPIGCVATVAALLGATYHLRKGNRNQFNQFLRYRIYAQGLTVGALMVYGGIALSNDQQEANAIKQRIALGELPANTYYPGRKDVPKPRPGSEPALSSIESEYITAIPENLSTAVDAPPSLSREAPTGAGGAYPLRKQDRMKVSDFAKRLKEAEQIHKEEEAVKKAGKGE